MTAAYSTVSGSPSSTESSPAVGREALPARCVSALGVGMPAWWWTAVPPLSLMMVPLPLSAWARRTSSGQSFWKTESNPKLRTPDWFLSSQQCSNGCGQREAPVFSLHRGCFFFYLVKGIIVAFLINFVGFFPPQFFFSYLDCFLLLYFLHTPLGNAMLKSILHCRYCETAFKVCRQKLPVTASSSQGTSKLEQREQISDTEGLC